MSTQTFHSFPLLPRELRDMIWEECIHPKVPSAHFFTLYSYDHREHELDELSGHHVSCVERSKATIAAPRSRETGEISWRRHNKSAYLIDHGLWTACRESREMIQRRYSRQGRVWGDPFILRWKLDSAKQAWYADSLPGSFQEDGRLRCFTICPSADLLCLQPFRYTTTDWGAFIRNLRWSGPDATFAETSYFSGPMPDSSDSQMRYHIFGSRMDYGIKNVGLELDPDWITHFDGRKSYGYDFEPGNGPPGLQCAAQAATCRLYWVNYLWLIDYRIRLKPGVTYTQSERYVFSGLGCTFVEVQDGDDTWSMADSRDVKKPDRQIEDEDQAPTKSDTGPPCHSLPEILDFARKLYHSVDRYILQELTTGRVWIDYQARSPLIGILACVFDN
ncbi:hypothetical protein F5B17DRAFT_426505 [Nemania serpens]|nr:hypothetical protein F5B17DRAFT_426505 [Nemania serpens]